MKPLEPMGAINLPDIVPRRNEANMLDWLDRMPNQEAREVAEFMLDNTTEVGFESFVRNLGRCTKELMVQLEDRPYVVVLPADEKPSAHKSEIWVSSLAQAFTNNAPVNFVNLRDIAHYLKEHPEIGDVVIYDDASYSAERLSNELGSIYSAHRLCHAKDPTSKLQVHAVVPYTTAVAKERLEKFKEYKPAEGLNTKVYTAEQINTLKEIVEQQPNSQDIKQILKKYFEIDLESPDYMGLGLTYFQHKFPDGWSYPAAIGAGYVYNEQGKLIDSTRFMPQIVPPYKK